MANKEVAVVFETEKPILFSLLTDNFMNKTWQPWAQRYLLMHENGILIYKAARDGPSMGKLDLKGTNVSQMVLDSLSGSTESVPKESGIIVSCHHVDDNIPTSFRCIFHEDVMNSFLQTLKIYVKTCSINTNTQVIPTFNGQPTNNATVKFIKKVVNPLTRFSSRSAPNRDIPQSFMRQSLEQAMNRHDQETKFDRIMNRRGKCNKPYDR
jgi:hypothetical protein